MVQNGTVVFMMFITDVLMVVILVLQIGLRNRLKTPQTNMVDLAAMAENMSRINKNVIEMAKLNQETIQLNKAIIGGIPAAVKASQAVQDAGPVKVPVGDNSSEHKVESLADLWPDMDEPEVPAPETSAPAESPQRPKLYNPVIPVKRFMDPHNPKAWSPEERKAFGEQMKERRAEEKAKREAEAQSQVENTQ